MDEERAQIEEVLQRGEQMLHQPMEDNKKEKIRLQLLLLHTRYNKTKVLLWESLCPLTSITIQPCHSDV